MKVLVDQNYVLVKMYTTGYTLYEDKSKQS